ncbi:unnamed protein product [Lampetra fluviatilis]
MRGEYGGHAHAEAVRWMSSGDLDTISTAVKAAPVTFASIRRRRRRETKTKPSAHNPATQSRRTLQTFGNKARRRQIETGADVQSRRAGIV